MLHRNINGAMQKYKSSRQAVTHFLPAARGVAVWRCALL
jgi:hypothetical protein